MNHKKWDGIALFIIALVISIPFYSAQVMASSIQITKNTGQKNIDNFLDAQNDIWSVQAVISNIPEGTTIAPQDVKIKVGDNQASFSSCSSADALGVNCQYLSSLPDGIEPGTYPFTVTYTGIIDEASDNAVINADATAPVITFTPPKVWQEGGKIKLSFTASDEQPGKPCVGIAQLEIIDANTNQVLYTIPHSGSCTYDVAVDPLMNGALPVALTGEGVRHLKIKAEDRLGHAKTSEVVSFDSDFVEPDIKDALNLPDLGKFIGAKVIATDINVSILESHFDPTKVKAFSAQMNGIDGKNPDECNDDPNIDNLWHCLWKNIEVQPDASISMIVEVEDTFGNKAQKTLTSAPLVKDTDAPIIDYFGTQQQYNGVSYIKKGVNRILLKVHDDGAGIDAHNIRANLGALGKTNSEEPKCEQVESSLNCYWETSKVPSGVSARIGLTMFQDRVGNEGDLKEVEMVVDNSGPLIQDLQILGRSLSGDKDYFQSNDKLIIKFTAVESSGILLLLNLNDVVQDAPTKYPQGYKSDNLPAEDGWEILTAEDMGCERQDGIWSCTAETDTIKSGFASSVHFTMDIQDTAGNSAQEKDVWIKEVKNLKGTKGKYTFELLGVATEEQPDFWEMAGKTDMLIPFVDLDVVNLIPVRVPFTFTLKSDNPQVKVLSMEIAPEGCTTTGKGPEVQRALVLGSVSASEQLRPKSTLILELSPFNPADTLDIPPEGTFDQVTVDYTCKLRVFSKVGTSALSSAEIQDVPVEVSFAYSELGSVDENLAKKIKDVRESDFMKFADTLATVDIALKWINYVVNIAQILVSVNEFINIWSELDKAKADIVEKLPLGQAAGIALRGGCFAKVTNTKYTWDWLKYIQVPAEILNCNPNENSALGNLGWYGKWQRTVLESYNLASGRGVLGIPATNLYENLYASSIGLCVPGIIYNINKAREIHCRKIICYGREVPAGIATVDACDKLYDLQMCEFVYGPLLDLSPLGGIAAIGKMVQSAFTSPLGLISVTEVVACGSLCFVPLSPGALTTCRVTTGINKALTIINSLVETFKGDNTPRVQGSPYCDQAEKIDINELVKTKSAPADEKPAEVQPSG